MFSEERKVEISGLINKKGSIEVNDLAKLFATSRETIRRDLRELEQQGVLIRTHGGAILGPFTAQPPEPPVGERGIQQMEEKRLICQKAARYIKANDTLFVDNSTTMLYLPRYIPPELNITIVTNSIGFLYETSKVSSNHWLLICLQGMVRSRNLSVYGYDTLKSAEPYYPAKTFISCTGISPVNKIADSSPYEVDIKRMMIERSQEVFLLADHTKLGKQGPVFLCNFSSIKHLVTDKSPGGLEGGMDFLKDIDIITADA